MDTSAKAPLPARICFIAACIVLVLTSAMHLIATLAPQPELPDETGRQLMELLRTYRLALPGTERTMEQLIKGYSFHFGLSLLGIALVSAVGTSGRPGAMRPVAAAGAILLGAMAANSIAWFFIIPTVCLGLAAALFAGAAAAARTPPSTGAAP